MLNLRQTFSLLGLSALLTAVILGLSALLTAVIMVWHAPSAPPPAPEMSLDIAQDTAVSHSETPAITELPIPPAEAIIAAPTNPISQEDISAPETWISPPLNELSNSLYDFIENEDIRYVSTEDVPFDESQRQAILELAQSGQMVMFDNSDSAYLDSYGLTESQVVSEFFGTAAAGDVILATGVTHPQGGIHYLVLPLEQGDTEDTQWLSDIQRAVMLLKAQQQEITTPSLDG
ncbi:hypothetical protein [Vibrio coralliilyticus]|uniref:hypothetical protein n=1 Tax=Vibrio coralliilyticus TaxID=190893 RepID=UPI000BAAC5A5|nr:hypothetical protein [Vibrio coralliilyticus]NOI59156.1 hypothetical protein [Vibrio coralliilyticus]PAT66210.1 hypothetical protein CKA27_20525 [Vibrio coralliilyticus]